MYMMKIRTILFAWLLLFAACSDDDTDTVVEQQEDIVSFLTSTHSPALISEKSVAESLDDDPEFYSTSGYTTYRYIEDYYNTDREQYKLLEKGDVITITFWCYDFSTYTTPSDSYLYYTNDPAYEQAFQEAGLNTQYWSFEPLEITLGAGDILNSIETALVGCRVNDKVELYLTYNMAYGSQWVGVTSLEEPMAFFCTIDSIEN